MEVQTDETTKNDNQTCNLRHRWSSPRFEGSAGEDIGASSFLLENQGCNGLLPQEEDSYARETCSPGLTPTAPLVTEGGGKIVDAEGNVLAFYPLQNEEIRQLAGPLQDEHLDMACFCRFSDGKYILYSPEGTANESESKMADSNDRLGHHEI